MTVYVMGDMHGDFDPIFTVLSYIEFKKRRHSLFTRR